MKKKMMLFAAVAMSVSMLAGTSVTALAQDTARVGSLKGPTSMGLVSFMNEAETEDDEDVQFTFEMMAAADEVSAGFTSGDLDIALVPANIASILYNKTEGKVQVIDVNTLGVLYIVTADESIAGVADLKGKTIYSTGKGQTPEYVLNYLLEANGISQDDVTVEFKSEATEVVSVLAQD